MFKIYDGREHFYQWDLDRKLIIEDPSVIQVHFCNRTDNCSLVCETYVEDGITLVNVPNILLQTDWKIHVYAYDGKHTKFAVSYDVASRTKPADYAYTETEILNWSKIDFKVSSAIGNTETATAYATAAAQKADSMADVAYVAAGEANDARGAALIAADEASGAAAYATEAASGVVEATDAANAAAEAAFAAEENAYMAISAIDEEIFRAREATDAAIKATEDAITATGNANEAADNAQNAANNADVAGVTALGMAAEAREAADRANNAASGINDKFANALKGNKSGEIVAITDISPIEHNVTVKAASKNVIPYPYINTTQTKNGIEYTDNKDGTVTIDGSNPEEATFFYFASFVVQPGSYILSGCPENGSFNKYYLYIYEVDTKTYYRDFGKGVAYNTDKEKAIKIYMTVNANITMSNHTVKPMLRDASVSNNTYTPYVPDVSAASVKVLGKNLLDISTDTRLTKQEDGSYINNARIGSTTKNPLILPYNTYVISYDLKCPVGKNARIVIVLKDGTEIDMYKVSTDDFVHFEKAITGEIAYWYFKYAAQPLEETLFLKNVQLEIGTAATPYEDYKEPISYPIAADGTVEGVTSIYPSMTITTDTTGVTVDTEYNRDINKAFAELQNALISLGGNV